ncbi:PTS system, N-acetylgalactosamine-specific IIA component/PTS system, mannose-specific IIA component/PTS system, fructoselysine and glucoselysine-specific IIA component [Granulicatella balaenopterae]|uniref:PTS system, N-acetylgalactosamine-specific IIA component/PTS system, mannose-specific IIA component/PTS system, fructoselysine and glucoselysine-specific IIA component n=1 Tax=Granulicatella balaenopterae TaxID=137733 RepID=A0A1H9J1S0_9LACT|nr:PTS sugar transporter subunit IIA [Granulicatella balaenopterae]SEQ80712.1 PTS system, N-acetylgalactosamine-specific IIA component/PTS system, mannose-specific IIA component/PTS system, fructoselysine and glucoselysine-specific IIA component [Granulicatella balaenopterae]
MKNKLGVLLASHGQFAKETLKTVEMIVGKFSKDLVDTVGLQEDLGIKDFEGNFDSKLNELLKQNEQVIILTDLIGGTPNNIALKYALKNDNIQVVTGYNMALALTLLSNLQNSIDLEMIINESRTALFEVTKQSDNSEEVDEEWL